MDSSLVTRHTDTITQAATGLLLVTSAISSVGLTWWAGQQGAMLPTLAGAAGIATTTALMWLNDRHASHLYYCRQVTSPRLANMLRERRRDAAPARPQPITRPRRYRVLTESGEQGEHMDTLQGAADRAADRAAWAPWGRAAPVRVERRRVFEHGQVGPWRKVPEAEWVALLISNDRDDAA